jgi:hypothetical protein
VTARLMDIATRLGDYEAGELDWEDTLALFGDLVASGYAWHLQGSYGRTAATLIREGSLDEEGNIL